MAKNQSWRDYSLLTVYSSLPFNKTYNYYENYVDAYFKNYSKSLQSSAGNKLFKPVPYLIWGKFDLAVLSLVDDFEFSAKFRPNFSREPNDEDYLDKFEYQVNIGTPIGFNYNETTEKAEPTPPFHRENDRFPFIAITQFKLNNAFLIGGSKWFTRIVVEKIKEIVKKHSINKEDIKIDHIVSSSFSYFELNLILFSNSFKAMGHCIMEIRELRLKDLFTTDNKEKYNTFAQRTLANKWYPDYNKFRGNHVFENTVSNVGYDPCYANKKVWDNNYHFIEHRKADGNIYLFSKWHIKPGHTAEVKKILTEFAKNEVNKPQYFLVSGQEDMLIKYQIDLNEGCAAKQQLIFPDNIITDDQHILETETNVAVAEGAGINIPDNYDAKEHADFYSMLPGQTIKKSEINEVSILLRKLQCNKVVLDKVLKILSVFNNAMLTPNMYASYLELLPYFKKSFIGGTIAALKKGTHNPETYKLNEYIKSLESISDHLELSFQNRLNQSYWAMEMADMNLNFSGGMHNLLAAYDFAFKAINLPFCKGNEWTQFAYVHGHSGVKSTPYVLKLNFLHLFQPAIFSAIATHEVCNFILDGYIYDELPVGGKIDKRFSPREVLRRTLIADRKSDYKTTVTVPLKQKFFVNNVLKISGKVVDERLKNNIYYRTIHPRLFNYFIVDILNLYLGYNNNTELFLYWNWAYFVQFGYSYSNRITLDRNMFDILLMRMCMVEYFSNNGSLELNKKIINELKYSVFDPADIDNIDESGKHSGVTGIQFDIDWQQLELWFTDFADNSNFPFKDWFNYFHDFAKVFIALRLSDGNADFRDNEALNKFYEERKKKINAATYEVNARHKIKPVVHEIANDTINLLIKYQQDVLKDSFKENLHVLLRDIHGKPDYFQGQNSKDVLLDPCGGTFIYDETARREYLKSRSSFITTLWDLSMQAKKMYIQEEKQSDEV